MSTATNLIPLSTGGPLTGRVAWVTGRLAASEPPPAAVWPPTAPKSRLVTGVTPSRPRSSSSISAPNTLAA